MSQDQEGTDVPSFTAPGAGMSQLTGSTLQETADDPPPKDPGKSSGGNSDPPQSQARAAGATIETFTKIVEVVMERPQLLANCSPRL